jgi:hypothetical protein
MNSILHQFDGPQLHQLIQDLVDDWGIFRPPPLFSEGEGLPASLRARSVLPCAWLLCAGARVGMRRNTIASQSA